MTGPANEQIRRHRDYPRVGGTCKLNLAAHHVNEVSIPFEHRLGHEVLIPGGEALVIRTFGLSNRPTCFT
jgi:hypothetical protein